ncbi:uncharacterized protein LOC131947856 [Physella acuta]|uniref:uncharacterized protein LOC131947856 n=1 Tax=Physella acuta TaxID=109671 RepID=UPI0027DAD053|nr:uncharacterized protein LOC131947856 [Physella acuta]
MFSKCQKCFLINALVLCLTIHYVLDVSCENVGQEKSTPNPAKANVQRHAPNLTQKVDQLRKKLILLRQKGTDLLNAQTAFELNVEHVPENRTEFSGEVINRTRTRRYTYEDTHNWPNDDSQDYDFDENGETKEVPFWVKVSDNWQVVGFRMIFLLSAVSILLMICCCCCKICCRMCCQSIKDSILPCRAFLDLLTSCYEDPMYKRAKNLAELMGLKLDYATYLKIKANHDVGGTGTFNPLGLPYMA